jgi:hypothetical protein
MRNKPPHTNRSLPDTLKFLELLGFKFELDLMGDLEITEPGDIIEIGRIMWIVDQCLDQIKSRLVIRGHNAMHQFVGGPLNGQQHDYCYPRFVAIKQAPKHWAAYRLVRDGRAFFCGWATSEAKARLKCSTTELPAFDRRET